MGLSQRKIAKLTEPGRYGDSTPTLYMVLSPGGSKAWVQRLTIGGCRTDLGLGGFPLVSIEEAREAAWANRRLVRQRGDPRAEKRKAQVPTFREAAEKCGAVRSGKARSAAKRQGALEKHVYPVIGSQRVNEIRRSDVLRVLKPLPAATQSKVKSHIKTTMAWCQSHEFIDANPCDGIKAALPTARPEHRKALHYSAVPESLEAIANSGANEVVKACLRFVILTACRSGEARGATWDEIDFEAREWRIPPERMKGGVEHRVPLTVESSRVLGSVRGLHDRLVFPSTTRGVMHDATLGKVLKRAGIDCSVHGYRSSFRTWAMEEANVTRDVAELALAHQIGSSVERSYARGTMYRARAELMSDWAAYCLTGVSTYTA